MTAPAPSRPRPDPLAPPPPAAPLWRRLAAAGYDLLPLAAILMSLGFLVTALRRFEPVPPGSLWFEALLLVAAFAYFGSSWVLGGQTLGMRAWRIAVRRIDGGPLGWGDALLRFLVALPSIGALGAGVLWALAEPRRRTWHDLAADTEVVLAPPRRAGRSWPVP